MIRPVQLAAGTVAGALFVWVAIGPGFVNYDTLFNLTWGEELVHGASPRLGLPLAPTPKPLVIGAGSILAPLGHASQDVVAVGALFALGLLAVAAYALASHFAGRPAGLLAAGLVLTREPVLSFGVRAYVDILYAALVLFALVLVVRRTRSHGVVLTLLALAGLLRPEAWLFSMAYVVLVARAVGPRHVAVLAPLALAAPLLWATSDLALAGDPLFSLTGTRSNAEVLQRSTGLRAAIELAPRRVGEIVREPVLFAALGGMVLMGRRWGAEGRRVLGALGLGLLAFGVLTTAGLPALGRYLLLDAMLFIVLAAIGLAEGARLAGRGHRGWLAFAVTGGLALAAFTPAQAGRLERLRSTIGAQATITDDLHVLADAGALSRCAPVRAPNHRLRPMLAAWLHRPPQEIAAGGALRGMAVIPATRRVERLFILDPRDVARTPATAPLGALEVSSNRSWRVFSGCPPRSA